MNLSDVQELALTNMCENKLSGWSFDFNNSRTTLGMTYVWQRRIELSKHLVKLDDDIILDVIKHECAHAVTQQGHTGMWLAYFMLIGGSGNIKQTVPDNFSKWVGICKNGHKIFRNRLTKSARQGSCFTCSRTFNPEFLFTWKTND